MALRSGILMMKLTSVYTDVVFIVCVTQLGGV